MKNSLIIISILIFSFSLKAIDVPEIYIPSSGSTGYYTDRSVQCYIVNGITDVNNYTFEIDTLASFDSPLYSQTVGTDYYSSPTPGIIRKENIDLYYGTTYYWRVKVTDGVETSVWSETWSFTTLSQLSLHYPYNESTDQSTHGYLRVNFEDYNTDFLNYEFELDTTPNFDSPLYSIRDGEGYSSTYDYMFVNNENLMYGTTYYWRARVNNSNSTSDWSEIWNFTTLSQLSLHYPYNESTNQAMSGYLRANIENYNTDFLNYEFEMDTTPNFNSPLYSIRDGEGYSSTYNYAFVNNTNLLFGTTYYWRARVHNLNNISTWSDTWYFTTTNGEVSLLSPSNGATDKDLLLNLDWSGVTGNDGYIYQIDTTPDFNSALFIENTTSVNSSQIDVSDLYFGTTYYWRACAKSAIDTSDWSATWSFTTKSTVINLSPSNTSTNQAILLNIDWSGITGNDGYMYQLDTVSDFSSSIFVQENTALNTSNTDISNLYFNTTYYWRACAKSVNDTSSWSSTWHFTTSANVTNVSPSNGAINQNPLLTLDWTYITGNNGYIYQLDTTPDFNSSLFYEGSHTDDFSETEISNLLFGTTYYWRVACKSTIDTTNWSSTWNFTTINTVTNVSPSNGAINQEPILTLDWTYITGNNGYIYQLDTTPDFNSALFYEGSHTDDVSQIEIDNLLFGTTYYWRAACKSTIDTTDWSETWNFITLSTISNVSPSNGAISQNISLNLDWTYINANDGYLCEIDTSPNFNSGQYQFLTSAISTSNIDVSELLYGATYYWRAAVKSINDTSDWSTPWHFTTDYELVDFPVLVSPADSSIDISYTSTIIEWNQSTGATTYQYQYSTDANFENSVFSGITSLSYKSISDLIPLTEYYWRVRGQNATGNSPWSEIWIFTTENAILVSPVLISPANNATGVDFNTVTLDWESVFGAFEYIYEISPDSNFSFAVTTETISNTEATLVGFESNTIYYWRAKSSDGVDESDWSAIWNFKTMFGVNIIETELNELVIYPNPSNGIFFIEGHNYEKLELINIYGQVVQQILINNSQFSIDISKQPKGIYFLNIVNENVKITKKLILK